MNKCIAISIISLFTSVLAVAAPFTPAKPFECSGFGIASPENFTVKATPTTDDGSSLKIEITVGDKSLRFDNATPKIGHIVSPKKLYKISLSENSFLMQDDEGVSRFILQLSEDGLDYMGYATCTQ